MSHFCASKWKKKKNKTILATETQFNAYQNCSIWQVAVFFPLFYLSFSSSLPLHPFCLSLFSPSFPLLLPFLSPNMAQGASTTTRWCPTTEQVMILEEMYKGGVRNPNASQIQQITAHLSTFGRVEGKNVFYWFQNHKARDRQKLRRKLLRQQQQQNHYLEEQQQQEPRIRTCVFSLPHQIPPQCLCKVLELSPSLS